ncbi:hypothetical protein [Micromonospora sp. NPDC048830]|uniref:hypothetical protein n=1 Tax=Micromonospora sp. NPDC048830 TaxID=3364257 RepID=UPI003723BE02
MDAPSVGHSTVSCDSRALAEPAAGLIADLTGPTAAADDTAAVYGDAAYGDGEVLQRLDSAGIDAKTKVQPPDAPTGKFTKHRFDINLRDATVTCPGGSAIPIRPVKGHARHAGKADFGTACATCEAHREWGPGLHEDGFGSRPAPPPAGTGHRWQESRRSLTC